MKLQPQPPIDVFVGSLSTAELDSLSIFRDKNRQSFRWWFVPGSAEEERTIRWKDRQSMDIVKHDKNLLVLRWDLNTFRGDVAAPAEQAMYYRVTELDMSFLMLDSNHYLKDRVVLFSDSFSDSLFPQQFVRIPVFSSCADLLQFCQSSQLIRFSLMEESVFRKDSVLSKREKTFVGVEIANGRIWYLDQLHKDHYEVFDRNRHHLGEASLEGELIPGTAVRGRTI